MLSMCRPARGCHSVCTLRAGQKVSPWHDVSLHNPDGTLNFVCEIPKDTMAKMEVATVRSAAFLSPPSSALGRLSDASTSVTYVGVNTVMGQVSRVDAKIVGLLCRWVVS